MGRVQTKQETTEETLLKRAERAERGSKQQSKPLSKRRARFSTWCITPVAYFNCLHAAEIVCNLACTLLVAPCFPQLLLSCCTSPPSPLRTPLPCCSCWTRRTPPTSSTAHKAMILCHRQSFTVSLRHALTLCDHCACREQQDHAWQAGQRVLGAVYRAAAGAPQAAYHFCG